MIKATQFKGFKVWGFGVVNLYLAPSSAHLQALNDMVDPYCLVVKT